MIRTSLHKSWGIAIALTVVIAGCGRSKTDPVPVRGTVTVDGATVPGPGRLYFTSVEPAAGCPTRSGTAKFDAQGNYAAKTYKPGDGLLPGRYQIGVHCWKSPPNMSGTPVISFVSKEVQSAATSGLEIKIEPGSNPVAHAIDVPGMK